MSANTNALGQPVGFPVAGPFPRPRPPRTTMTGQHCAVVPLDPVAHLDPLHLAFAADADARNWTYLPYGPFADKTAFAQWLTRMAGSDDPLFHTILDPSGRAVGLASYLRIEPKAGVIEVGHLHFSPLLQGTRAATEAMLLMMARVFDELGYRRYEWKCDSLNARSRRAALRFGFSFEGLFRQATHYKGRNRDTAWYALIDQDWPPVRAAYRTWLADDNFDTDGTQRRSLTALMRDVVPASVV